jgi:hypothetical protein
MPDERPNAIPLYLSWLGTLCGSLLLLLGDVFPVRLPFVRPDTLFVCLLEVELAFMVFAWPWFLPSLAEPGAPARQCAPRLFREAGLLLVASLPPAIMAANVSNVGVAEFLGSQALVAALAGFAAVLFSVGRERRWPVGSWYVLLAFGLSAFLPFLSLVSSTIAVADLTWLSRVSPFWAAGNGEVAWPAAIFGGLAAALLVAGAFTRPGMDAPARTG